MSLKFRKIFTLRRKEPYFRRKGKKYQHKRASKYRIDNRRMIDRRPKIIEKREHLGHWEGDTVVGPRGGSKQVILTNAERKSGYYLATKLQSSHAEGVTVATKRIFSSFPKYKKKTITYDNGREFSDHRMIEYFTKMTVYFAHPYHSWERGTNENTNGLLRQFIPKGTDMKDISEEELQQYIFLLNSRPRKRLNYLTPYEVFIEGKSPNSI